MHLRISIRSSGSSDFATISVHHASLPSPPVGQVRKHNLLDGDCKKGIRSAARGPRPLASRSPNHSGQTKKSHAKSAKDAKYPKYQLGRNSPNGEAFLLKFSPWHSIRRRDDRNIPVVAANISADILRAADNYDPFVTDTRPLATSVACGPRS